MALMKNTRLLGLMLAATAIVPAASLKNIQNREVLTRAQSLRTDDRVRLLEQKSGEDRNNTELKVALAEALLQKLRETGDVAYLTRASKVIEPVLATDGKNVPALRVRNAIEMNLHHFPRVAAYAQAMLADNPSDAPTLSLL